MIISFSVENFKSFRDKTTLSFEADTTLPDMNPGNVVEIGGYRLLKTLGIYGANASGKSNMIAAMANFVGNMFVASNEELPFYPYKLEDQYLEKPTCYKIAFLMYDSNPIHYEYSYSHTGDRIHSEVLYQNGNLVFERKSDGTLTLTDHFSQAYFKPEDKSNYINIFSGLLSGALKNQLYISLIGREKVRTFIHEVVNDLFWKILLEWFMVNTSSSYRNTNQDINAKPGFKDFLLSVLDASDINIADVTVKQKKEPDPINFPLKNDATTYKLLFEPEDHMEVKLFHSPNRDTAFTLDEESEGTKTLYGMSAVLYHSLVERNGRLMLQDELDRSLHPLLTRFILQLFHREATNPHNAQLLYTTHDISLLDLRKVRPDQIYFTEKGQDGASRLVRLSDYEINWEELRTPDNINKLRDWFLAGAFAGSPSIFNSFIFDYEEEENISRSI